MQCPYAFFWFAICVALTHAALVPAGGNESTCGKWHHVLEDLQVNLFNNGQCNDLARQSLRITFHDTVGYSSALWTSGTYGGGGADGSLIKFSGAELAHPANKGLHPIVDSLKHLADRHNVSYGDIIQFAGAVGLSNCPGAPRLGFFSGRPMATSPAPSGLFPAPTDTAQTLLCRMQDVGFSAEDTVALLGAHSIGRQHTIDPAANGTPLDSTPGAFDSQFYLEVLLKGTVYPRKAPHAGEALSATKDVFRLSSDAAVARYPSTACAWQSYIGDDDRMRRAFRKAMKKVATLGHKIEDLVDCSHVIPVPRPWNKTASYPDGFGPASIERSCPKLAPQLSRS